MTTERERGLTNWIVEDVVWVEASKGKKSVKGEEQVKDNSLGEGGRKRTKLLRDISKEVDTEADQEGEEQEGDK